MGRFDALTNPSKLTPLIKTDTTEIASKPANQQTSKEASHHAGLPANIQTSKPPNLQGSKSANQQTSKPVKKFSSYLSEESLKKIKRIAFETDRKDYEVLQEAIDLYLIKPKS
jgi:hypothetical protein